MSLKEMLQEEMQEIKVKELEMLQDKNLTLACGVISGTGSCGKGPVGQ